MQNPFDIIATRLSNIEALLIDIKHYPSPPISPNDTPYGDFKWLATTCTGIPESTLRIKSAAGKIPGVVKWGKRVMYNKDAVISWLDSQTHGSVSATELDRVAAEQVNSQLRKRSQKGGRSV